MPACVFDGLEAHLPTAATVYWWYASIKCLLILLITVCCLFKFRCWSAIQEKWNFWQRQEHCYKTRPGNLWPQECEESDGKCKKHFSIAYFVLHSQVKDSLPYFRFLF